MKPARILRADTLRHGMNRGKEAKLRAFVADYRRLAVALGREQWRLFFESGRLNRIVAVRGGFMTHDLVP